MTTTSVEEHVVPASGRLPWDRGRDPAVDLVRGVAVICMIIAHVRVWAPITSVPAKAAVLVVNNVASPLFALVMGVSVGIVLTRSARPVTGTSFIVRNLVRGLLLIAIGVGLEQLHTFVAIVLMSLGATLVVAAPFALLPVRVLAGVALLTFAVGPVVNAAARAALDLTRVYSRAWLDQVLQWLVLSTHYRVVSLLPFALIGIVLARRGLTRAVALWTVLVGLAAGVGVGLLRLGGVGIGVSEVASGDLPDALLDVALAGCALEVVVLVARSTWAEPVVAALAPVRAVGAVALTAYVLHVGLISVVMRALGPVAYEHWPVLTSGILLATVLTCWFWWVLVGRGPVERLMALVSDRVVALAGAR